MNVIILMAGKGERFKNVGIHTPKPMVEVNGKSILEWTTRSLPFIEHYNEKPPIVVDSTDLYFAILEDDEEQYNISQFLTDIYGEDIHIIKFGSPTAGSRPG